MKLSLSGLKDPQYTQKGYSLPEYDIPSMRQCTLEAPTWIHFGAGNIFRAFPAAAVDTMLSKGEMDKGIIVAESYDDEILTKAYHPYDELSLLVTLKADGSTEKRVIASVAASYSADPSSADAEALTAAFTAPSLQMVSFTVTEKGYATSEDHFEAPVSIMGRITKLLLARFEANAAPVALVSMDNCSHNGDKIKAAVLSIASQWQEKGLCSPEFLAYLQDAQKVSYPWSMIDKITPRPDEKVKKMLEADGFEDTDLIITDRHTFTAPFVNAEETGYLIIQDDFPNGRPPLEKGGLLFTARETVDKVERMKVCTCLNPLHTALAVFGCLLDFTLISDEMKDDDLRNFVTRMAYDEALPVVTSPGIIAPEEFLSTVLNVRLPNPFMPDAPQRIATDTSQKLPIRFGETIKAYMADDQLDVSALRLIPVTLAGWLRYLEAVDDNLTPFELSPDPLFPTLLPLIKERNYEPLLHDATIFGVDLYEAGLAEEVLSALSSMQEGKGAIRRHLKAVLA